MERIQYASWFGNHTWSDQLKTIVYEKLVAINALMDWFNNCSWKFSGNKCIDELVLS